jgi:hypothetical protein
MTNRALRALLPLLLLGCSAPSAQDEPRSPAAPARAAEERDAPGPGGFEPIRFGDQGSAVYDEPFFPGAEHDPAVPTPESILGQEHGTRLAHHAEILAFFRALAEASDRVRLEPHGWTHEGRELVHAVVSSPANLARLGEITADLARLRDPRGLSQADADAVLARALPVAWMGYSIHGDELSGADAAVALGYHLAAATDADVAELLDGLVVVIDPVMNPDGRERIIAMVEQSAGRTLSLDYDSMQRGRWPYGRGNHYLFDLNRDWMAGTQPETRARWQAVRSFHPQLFVDAHEMGSLDTYLFYPQAEPLNPSLPARLIPWQQRYAAAIAEAFDQRGWAYYTREWADGWAPFYSDSWGSLIGGTGMLYEQARTAGAPLRQASGRILTYREAVHHQAVASLASLRALAEHKDEALADFAAQARRNVAEETPGSAESLVVVPRGNPAREREFVRILTRQGIEVFRARAPFRATDARGARGERMDERELPAGALVVPARQPEAQMVRAYLSFEQRMDREALLREREDLLQKGESRVYDVTSWSLPLALDLDAWWCVPGEVEREPVAAPEAPLAPDEPPFDPARPPVAWLVDGADDASVGFAARALELGLAVHLADEPFRSGEKSFPRGSLAVRRNENQGDPAELHALVLRAAREAGVTAVHPASGGLSPDEGPDLGGQHFHLLARPRVALVGNAPIDPDAYGHLWYWLDAVLGLPIAILDAQQLGSYDLRRYNVLVLPPARGLQGLLEPRKDELAAWVRGGGTLVACGSSAAALTKERLGLSEVALRRDVLDELEPYREAARRDREARDVEIDEALVWGEAPPPEEEAEEEEAGEDEKDEDDDETPEITEQEDAWLRTFSPAGATLRGLLLPRQWITAGAEDELPVLASGSYVFLSREPVVTPVRLDVEERLRLGGLVWPEARRRLAESAWLTVERSGSGQIVLFADVPGFRGHHHATARLFTNAVVYGPGLGASQPIGW